MKWMIYFLALTHTRIQVKIRRLSSLKFKKRSRLRFSWIMKHLIRLKSKGLNPNCKARS